MSASRKFVSVHPLLWLLPMLGVASGSGQAVCVTAAALAVHECGHILCARALKAPLSSLRVTPFGGALTLDASLPPVHEILIAVCGPLANLLCIAVTCALCQFGVLNFDSAYDFVSANAALALINLLPAAPLDGGRILRALLSTRLSAAKVVRITAGLGIALAFGVMTLVLLGAMRGYVYVTLAVGALCIYTLAVRELRMNVNAAWQTHWGHTDMLESGACVPVREIAVSESARVVELLGVLRPGRLTRFSVYGAGLKPLGVIDESALLDAAVNNAVTVRECIHMRDG